MRGVRAALAWATRTSGLCRGCLEQLHSTSGGPPPQDLQSDPVVTRPQPTSLVSTPSGLPVPKVPVSGRCADPGPAARPALASAASALSRRRPMSGKVGHFEIPYDAGDRARRFYGEAFGWQLEAMPEMEY